MDHLMHTVFVPAFDGGTFEDALRAAAALAIRHGSMIDAAYVRDDFTDGPDMAELWATGGFGAQLLERASAEEKDMRARVGRVCNATGVGSAVPGAGGAAIVLRTGSGPMPRTAAEMARTANLSVIALRGPDKRKADAARIEPMLVGSGRPCLVVPKDMEAAPMRPVFCWNGSIEAGRALVGALPLFKAAEDVSVLTIGDLLPGLPDTEAVATFLRRSGVGKVTVSRIEDDRDRKGTHGDQIEQHAADFRSDLLVVGAYSRPRWEERVFGGVTRQMLSRPSRPVLFA